MLLRAHRLRPLLGELFSAANCQYYPLLSAAVNGQNAERLGAGMGGAFSELRASTKLDVWLQLKELLEAHRDGPWTVRPSRKRDAMIQMEREYPSRDWVLQVRLDK